MTAVEDYNDAMREIRELRDERDRLRAALEFYADPFVWKRKHDPDDDISVPDFYGELCFGEIAYEALGIVPEQGTMSQKGNT